MKFSQSLTKTKKDISSQEVSINAQLLERAGYINKLMAGVYSYLPLGIRVLTNIEKIVREEMDAIGSQEILMPALHPKEIWETTGRWNIDILYKLKAHDRELTLGPSHEETVVPIIGQYVQSYKDLPQALYQIQTKFRSEARPKSGILRGREFRMKDLYSFHVNQEDLDEFYDKVIEAYKRIFIRCGLSNITYLTFASGGIFSKYSHEFQTITPYGEDTVYVCLKCKLAVNKEIIAEQNFCPSCKSKDLDQKTAIEVGNIFKLGSRFTDAFKLKFADKDGSEKSIIMGCYGLGTSRLMGAIVEVLHDDNGICWPIEVAPYHVHLISLCKENQIADVQKVYKQLQDAGISVIFDDRLDTQAGAKFADADLLGMPIRIIMSPKTLAVNSAEVKLRTNKEGQVIPLTALIEWIKNELVK